MPGRRTIASFHTAWLMLVLMVSGPAGAVEVRQSGDDPLSYRARLTRAYVPCTAPNDVTALGIPACNPARTSACQFSGGEVTIAKHNDAHRIDAEIGRLPGGPPVCATGTYFLDIAIRTTADSASACPSGHCTFQDAVVRLPFESNGELATQRLDALLPFETVDPDVQILGLTVVAPDGLPLATAATFGSATSVTTNLTMPHEACTSPGPGGACDAAPSDAMCDFESGELTWVEGPLVGVRLRDLAGSSSLCATGTYRVDAMVRVTAASCTNGARCTLVDQQVSRSMMADGRDLARFASVTVSGITPMYDAIEIVSLRVLDPSGAAIAASGLTEVRSLEKPRISLGNDRIRIQATFPIPVGATALDPVRGDGLTVTLTDRDGPVFDVTIPPERWHVQRPAGHRWDYRNADGMLSGVRTARLKRVLKARRVIGYALDLEAKGVDLSAADFPGITLTLTLPGLPTGVFSAQQHRTCRATASTLDCR